MAHDVAGEPRPCDDSDRPGAQAARRSAPSACRWPCHAPGAGPGVRRVPRQSAGRRGLPVGGRGCSETGSVRARWRRLRPRSCGGCAGAQLLRARPAMRCEQLPRRPRRPGCPRAPAASCASTSAICGSRKALVQLLRVQLAEAACAACVVLGGGGWRLLRQASATAPAPRGEEPTRAAQSALEDRRAHGTVYGSFRAAPRRAKAPATGSHAEEQPLAEVERQVGVEDLLRATSRCRTRRGRTPPCARRCRRSRSRPGCRSRAAGRRCPPR